MDYAKKDNFVECIKLLESGEKEALVKQMADSNTIDSTTYKVPLNAPLYRPYPHIHVLSERDDSLDEGS